jgi:DNA-binding beta-propeller fold protein YncE
VSRDGCTLLVTDHYGTSHAVHEMRVRDGVRLRTVGGHGDGSLQFNSPRQVWIAPDGFVFVADCENDRVQVLTPALDFHGIVGVGQLTRPAGVCASDDVIVVSQSDEHCVTVFRRGDGALLHRFGACGGGDGQLYCPMGLCFMSGDRRIAVAEVRNSRVSVFSIDGAFVRHVGVGTLSVPSGVACFAHNELVVADTGNARVVVFSVSGSGDVLKVLHFRDEPQPQLFSGVAIHGRTIFAQDVDEKCVVIR